MRFLAFNEFAKGCGIRHINNHRLMSHLMPGCIRVAVHGNDLHTKALKSNDDFLAQFPGPK